MTTKTTRAEHMRWCKERAKKEYAYYFKTEGQAAAIRCGIASMMSDLNKHDETRDLGMVAMLAAMTVRDERSFNHFIDGFAE